MQEIVKMQFGSHVYGTNLPTSDIDYKAVYIPTRKQIILNQIVPVINETTKEDLTKKSTKDDIECETFAFCKFIKLLMESQTVPVGMLFVPEKWYVTTPTADWTNILENKSKLLSSGVSSFVGYCRTQANKYGIKGSRVAASKNIVDLLTELMLQYGKDTKLKDCWEHFEEFVQKNEHSAIVTDNLRGTDRTVRMIEVCNRKMQEFNTLKQAFVLYEKVYEEYGARARQAQQNENIDWKALMHACRVYTETKELLIGGHITYPRPDADFLMKVRLGELPYKMIAEYLEQGLEELEPLVEHSILRSQPDVFFAEDLIYKTYYRQMLGA